ncbi:MAG: hypothetical protein J6Y02_13180 [Pseudobutyrivibrio sp.]|nr:hypothetical protein [Pseudobutyrivibrio sp.]
MVTIRNKRGTTAQVQAYAPSAQVGELVFDTQAGILYACVTAGQLSQLANEIDIPTSITWDNITNKPSTYTPSSHTHAASDITSGLAAVATSNNYNDLSNKPTIPAVPSTLSSFTDDLGSSPVHTHSQYLTGLPSTIDCGELGLT